jgi:hypothetical protein
VAKHSCFIFPTLVNEHQPKVSDGDCANFDSNIGSRPREVLSVIFSGCQKRFA